MDPPVCLICLYALPCLIFLLKMPNSDIFFSIFIPSHVILVWVLPFVSAEESSPGHSQGHLLSATIIWTPLRCKKSINIDITILYNSSVYLENHECVYLNIWPERKTAFCPWATTSRSEQGDRDTMQSCSQGWLCPVVSPSTCSTKRKGTFKLLQCDLSKNYTQHLRSLDTGDVCSFWSFLALALL